MPKASKRNKAAPAKRPAASRARKDEPVAAAKPAKPAKAAAAKATRRAAQTGAAAGEARAATKARSRRSTAKRAPAAATQPPVDDAGDAGDDSKRNFGLRGAAPWVARHAAKHAAELRARNAQPPPPGSARATLRVPVDAEELKTKVAHLHQLASKVRTLRKRLDKSFYEIGEILAEVQRDELYVAKRYANFEAFLDREVDLGRTLAMRLVRISQTFVRDVAYDFGLDRLVAALAALDGEISPAPAPSQPSSRSFSQPALPLKPPIRFQE